MGTALNRCRASVLQDERFCKWMHFIHNGKVLNVTDVQIKMIKIVNFTLHVLDHNIKKLQKIRKEISIVPKKITLSGKIILQTRYASWVLPF